MPQGRACSDRACKHNKTGTRIVILGKHFDVMFTHTAEHPTVTKPYSNLILRQ